ncbi:MAG TPA: hypothetical protein VNQ73_16610 [Ilumatobacter sp.]|nr:hypothetical protein [Ilumatobacter sp.]
MTDDNDNDPSGPGQRPDYSGEQLAFGEVQYPWRSSPAYDGPPSPTPRRAELLGDAEDAWWADVTAWTEWAIATFRLSRWFPPCWLRHPALVEEAQALWLLWCEAWLGMDPANPAHWLYQLDSALHRIETRWQVPCTLDNHTEPTPIRPSARVRPLTSQWWSLDNFTPTDPAW